MALNPSLFNRLEHHGLTNEHLEQLLAICSLGAGRVTWHMDREGNFAKIEVILTASMRDHHSMRDLTSILQKGR